MNSALIGWALAVLAIAIGYVQYGWSGVALALGAIVFWLLLQFSRATRALRAAASRPIGQIPSAVNLQSKLRKGMPLTRILVMTGSLGEPQQPAQAPARSEHFRWVDPGGVTLTIMLLNGRLAEWEIQRPAGAADAGA